MTPTATHLLIIDAQNDFCDLPAAWCPNDPARPGPADVARLSPALPVPGSHADMQRLADFMRRCMPAIDAITVTLDSHLRVGIERPAFWRRRDGSSVAPFTPISLADFSAGEFAPRLAENVAIVRAYLTSLEKRGRYTLMVWPPHCVIGTWGHALHADVDAALAEWETARHEPVARVLKGMNPLTEHYSAIAAEVPRADEPDTLPNAALLARLAHAQRIVVAGEAGSHCVKSTVEDIADYLGPADVRRLVLLTDCMSPVAGFETHHAAFLQDMQDRGAHLATAETLIRTLNAGADTAARQ